MCQVPVTALGDDECAKSALGVRKTALGDDECAKSVRLHLETTSVPSPCD